MRVLLIPILLTLCASAEIAKDVKLNADGLPTFSRLNEYKNVTVTRFDIESITIRNGEGMLRRIKMEEVPKYIQNKLGITAQLKKIEEEKAAELAKIEQEEALKRKAEEDRLALIAAKEKEEEARQLLLAQEREKKLAEREAYKDSIKKATEGLISVKSAHVIRTMKSGLVIKILETSTYDFKKEKWINKGENKEAIIKTKFTKGYSVNDEYSGCVRYEGKGEYKTLYTAATTADQYVSSQKEYDDMDQLLAFVKKLDTDYPKPTE